LAVAETTEQTFKLQIIWREAGDIVPDLIEPAVAKVVIVQDLARLPGVFAYLAPRSWVA
jgi:hypothetical protein